MERARRRNDTPILLQFRNSATAGTSTPLDITTDFVLIYKETTDRGKIRKRVAFETSLIETGLIISTEIIYDYYFVKVNVPLEVFYRYAELLQLRMPIKLETSLSQTLSGLMVIRFLSFLNVKRDDSRKYTLMTEFKRDKLELFDMNDPEFFSARSRMFIASYILDRASFDDKNSGIQSLIMDGVYLNHYPLHEGSLKDQTSERYYLLKNWASLRNFFNTQPLDEIRIYFGPNFALFFTWQGFYSFMLIPIALIGCFSFIIGHLLVHKDGLITEICASNYTMCPKCDLHCTYWQLNTICQRVQMTYAKDNWAAIPLSVCFTVWGVLYISLWKRYRSLITYNWGLALYHSSEEHTRPQYLQSMAKHRLSKAKLNVVTLQPEPYAPFWKMTFPIYAFSGFIIFLMVVFYISCYITVNVYRTFVDHFTAHHASYIERHSIRVACLLISALIFVLIYVTFNKVAEILTNFEMHRTQSQYENSLYIKYYSFEFVLFYTGVVYSAFFKSQFAGHPGNYRRMFGFRQIECILDGCQFEIMLYTALFLVLKQLMFIISITLVPMIRLYKFKLMNLLWWRSTNLQTDNSPYNQMVEDNKLLDSKYLDVYNGYLHTVVEFGFITMFGIAFPLAPLLVLLSNTLNIRLGAYMYLKYYKRPVPRRVRNIGIWIKISDFICRLAVLTNAFLLAISSKFIPHMVFHYDHIFENSDLLKYTLSSFATSDFEEGTEPDEGDEVDVCYYFDYRYPHHHKFKYQRTMFYWKILATRLAFVVIYNIVVYTIVNFIHLAIPSMPSIISDKIQMEAYHFNKAILKSEKNETEIR